MISIHAPREGGDFDSFPRNHDFQISIHAPREGGDYRSLPAKFWPRNFNPRPLRGGRLTDVVHIRGNAVFQSTPPARGATHAVPPFLTS